MKIEDFWNQAFLSALGRLPAAEAKDEADKATELCIEFWRSNRLNWAPLSIPRWQDQDISDVPRSSKSYGDSALGSESH
jgi:hypothetical protein